ncbi:ligase-associated DNA damage response endonuclease PdeM [Flavobacterium sp. NST-5]|uniref:Ligase-associated DNA damage response endonuclease PdeM n=1 Tax=Flavobacterium ichthyis TaxID=2698827 RepID=A0ABW9Z520_9FLAO|nr:ligase-associated DNA damage response endonuclease PdeM [Flavobacterium ichthyis]NBL63652.1 ligase-associated DNA damage response endonuclease PdeM [Flavobacterium ichthyis]
MTNTIKINDNTFVLHSKGAVFWEEKKALLIADVHLGKVSHFRKHGVAVPKIAVSKNFTRLTEVVDYFNPESVIFLGDLFHSSKNSEWHLFVEWSNCCVAEIILIAGNHDVIAKENYDKISVKVFKELEIDGFLLTHHPTEREGFFNFSGHIHPGIKLRGFGGHHVKLPCFFQKENQMILPAFGEFTGKYILVPEKNDLVYVLANDEVVLIEKC